jgi:uncharacterized protein (TIRG00374 family)
MRAVAWTAGRALITIAVFAWVLRGFDADAAVKALAGFPAASLALALALIAVDRVLMFWRWRLLISAVAGAPVEGLARIFFVSSFLGSFLPAGVGGDAARAYAVAAETRQIGPALASVVVDRWLGLLAVGVSGCIGVMVSLAAVPLEFRELTLAATLLLAAGAVAGLYADVVAARLLPRAGADHRLVRGARRFADAVAVYRQHPGVLWRVALLSLVVQAARITLGWAIGIGLGITVPFRYYWVFMPLNILVILVPLSLGGFGLPQGTMVWTLGPLGVPATQAFLLSLLFVLAGVVGNLPGAAWYLSGRSAPARGRGSSNVG